MVSIMNLFTINYYSPQMIFKIMYILLDSLKLGNKDSYTEDQRQNTKQEMMENWNI